MKKKSVNVIKLGAFVLSGLALVILMLYLLGKNSSIFSKRFEVFAHFKDINGLLVGNNVRFSGINVGIVHQIEILNDTVIAVTLNLDKNMKHFVRANAVASLGTDGLIGNRVINITPVGGNAPFVKGGELLPSREEVNTQAMLQTLYRTNENIAGISEEIRATVFMIRSSSELSSILNDKTLSANLHTSLMHLNETTQNAALLTENAIGTLQLASKGKGTLANLLTDTTLMVEVNKAVQQIKTLETTADHLVKNMNVVVESVGKDINQGDGAVNTLLRDSLTAARLRATIDNAEKGTAAFAQDMEALKSNFLFRRYFKKQEKKAAKTVKKE